MKFKPLQEYELKPFQEVAGSLLLPQPPPLQAALGLKIHCRNFFSEEKIFEVKESMKDVRRVLAENLILICHFIISKCLELNLQLSTLILKTNLDCFHCDCYKYDH